jgi:hypothetical protein
LVNDVFDTRLGGLTQRRNVVVNLRIRSDLAVRLGLENHICELQLNLRSLAELMVRRARTPTILVWGSTLPTPRPGRLARSLSFFEPKRPLSL